MTAAKDGVQGRRRLRIFAAAVALVLLCAVCVGGVSGATYYASDEAELRANISTANSNPGDDTIIITDNIVLTKSGITRNNLPSPIVISSNIKITNEKGKSFIISSDYDPELCDVVSSSTNYETIDAYTLFHIRSGVLTLEGNTEGGSLSFTTGENGRAFDVNEDSGDNHNDRLSATLVINAGVDVFNCGFNGTVIEESFWGFIQKEVKLAASNNGGAIYVRNGGDLTMNGGRLSGNKAGAGGGVYIDSGGEFVMNGGAITLNFALNTEGSHDKWGGGVWVDNSGKFTWTGGGINGNTASSAPEGDLNYHEVYPKYNPPTNPETPSKPDYPIYVVSADGTVDDGYETISEAYEEASSKYDEFTIYIRKNFTQTYIEEKVGSSFAVSLDAVTIEDGKNVTLKPDVQSITLYLIGQMFSVSAGGKLTVAGNGDSSLLITSSRVDELVDGGFVSVVGGSFVLQDGVTISETKAKNGGAIYVSSGSCYLNGGVIQQCTATERGGAVYIAGGRFLVNNSFSLPDSNDIYLAENQVIAVTSTYSGTIGKITLSDYEEGRNVIDVTSNPHISADKFVLNPEASNEYEGKRLVYVNEGSKEFLELRMLIEYVIVIPDYLNISSETKYGTMQVTANKIHIPKDSWVSVTVVSDGAFTLTHTEVPSAKLPYNLLRDDGFRITNNTEVARFTMTEYQEKETLSRKPVRTLNGTVTELPPITGTYTDILTFTVEYNDA